MLAVALEAVARSDIDFSRLEVIVVDDGSSDGTSSIQNNSYPFVFHYLYQPNQGDALARNKGVEASHGELLVFLDDDVVVAPGLLAGLKDAHQGREGVIVLGTLITPGLSASEPALIKETHPSGSAIQVPFTECASGLMAISRADFYRIGPWQALTVGGSSIWCDVDLAYRANLAGFSFYRCPDAVGYHYDYTQVNLETRASREYRAGLSSVLLFHRYPQLQGQLPMFRDKTGIRWRQDSPVLIARKVARFPASTRLTLRLLEGVYGYFAASGRQPWFLNHLERWIIGGYIYRGFRQGLKVYGPI